MPKNKNNDFNDSGNHWLHTRHDFIVLTLFVTINLDLVTIAKLRFPKSLFARVVIFIN